MNTNMKTRLFSALLTLVMLIGLIPTTAFARDREIIPADSNNELNMRVTKSGILEWDSVSGATGYRVLLTKPNVTQLQTWDVTNNYFLLTTEMDGAKYDSGQYTLSVTAKGGSSVDATMPYYYTSHVDKLESPTNLRWDGAIARWNEVPGAASYNVALYDFDGRVFSVPTTNNYYDFSGNSPEDGWTFRVQARSNGTWSDKRYSNDTESPAKGSRTRPNTEVTSSGELHMRVTEGGILTWDAVSGASGYRVVITQPNISELYSCSVTETQFSLRTEMDGFKYDSGEYLISVAAKGVSGDDSMLYYYTSHVDKLESPANLRWNGSTAEWDAVPGAASYNVALYNFNGQVFSVPTTNTSYDFSGNSPKDGWTFRVQALSEGRSSDKRYSNDTESPAKESIPIESLSFSGLSVPVVGDYIQNVDGTDLVENPNAAYKYQVIDNQTCTWKDEEGRLIEYGAQVFEAGRTYSISFNVKPKDGYAFTREDIPVELSNLYSHQYKGSISLSTETSVAEVTFTFELAGERTYEDIKNFRFYQMRAPQDGDTVSITNGVWAYNNSEMTDRYWTDINGSRLETGAKFVGGNSYYYNYEFTAFEYYKFVDTGSLSVRADNEVPENWEYTLSNNNTQLHIKIPYYVAAAETINSIVVDGMFVPTQDGTTRDWDSNVYLSVSDGAGYQIPNQTNGWYETDAEYSNETEYEVTEKGFYAGKQYKMFLIVHAKDGYKFASPENVSFAFSGISESNYTYTFLDGGSEGIIIAAITFTAQFPAGAGSSAGQPAFCYSYWEFKYAMESNDIRYVALGDVEDMMPKIPHDEEKEPQGVDNVNPILVHGKKDLNLLGDATFSAPLSANYDLKCFKELLILSDNYDADLYIHGPGSLTFNSSYLDFYYSAIKVVGGTLCVDGATIVGSHGNHEGFCYGINALYGSISIQGGATIRGGVYDGPGVCALSLGDESFNGSLSVSIFDGNFYVDRAVEDGNHDHGIWVNQAVVGLRIYGATMDGFMLSRSAQSNTLGNYVQSGCIMTVDGVETTPSTYGTIDGKIIKVFKAISKVDIHINSPAAGKDIPLYEQDVYMVPDGCTVKRVTWLEDNESISTSQFIAGKSYTVEIALTVDDGVEFTTPLESATINYHAATVEAQGIGAEHGIILRYDFGVCPNTISEVELTIDSPMVGHTPDNFATYEPGGYMQALDGIQWQKSSNGSSWTKMEFTDTFVAGNYYRVYIDIAATTDYLFALDPQLDPAVSATVNGRSAEVSRYPEQEPDKLICVCLDFGLLSDTSIEQILIENVVEPMVGQTPSYTCTVGGNGYTINNAYNNPTYAFNGISWQDITDGENNYVWLEPSKGHTFQLGHTYKVFVDVKTEDGYSFSTQNVGSSYYPTGTGSINGKSAVLGVQSDGRTEQSLSVTFTCTKPTVTEILIDGLDAPQAGKTPDFTISVDRPNLYGGADYGMTGSGIFWTRIKDSTQLDTTDPFVEGETYQVEIKIVPKQVNGVNLCQFENPVIKINGETVAADVWPSANVVYIFYTFPPATAPESAAEIHGTIQAADKDSAPVATLHALSDTAHETPLYTAQLSTAVAAAGGYKWLFSFGEIPAATYDLVITKDGHADHVERLTVGSTDRDLGVIMLRPRAAFSWTGSACTVTVAEIENGVVTMAASYEKDRMVKVVFFTANSKTATLTGDGVKVFFLQNGTYTPVREAAESYF